MLDTQANDVSYIDKNGNGQTVSNYTVLSDAMDSWTVTDSNGGWYVVDSPVEITHDGAEAGTTGLAKRAEAIDVQILPQGQHPMGYDASQAACVSS